MFITFVEEEVGKQVTCIDETCAKHANENLIEQIVTINSEAGWKSLELSHLWTERLPLM